MTGDAKTQHLVAVQARSNMLKQMIGQPRRFTQNHMAGVIQGTALAYADLHGPRAATEAVYRVGDTISAPSLKTDAAHICALETADAEKTVDKLEQLRVKLDRVENGLHQRLWRLAFFFGGFATASYGPRLAEAVRDLIAGAMG